MPCWLWKERDRRALCCARRPYAYMAFITYKKKKAAERWRRAILRGAEKQKQVLVRSERAEWRRRRARSR